MHNEIRTYPISGGGRASSDFLIKEMGELYDQTGGKPDNPHRHDYYTVIHSKNSSGTHFVDFKKYPLRSSSLFFIYPGQVHQVIADSRPEGTVLNFTQDFLIRNGIGDRLISDI